MEPRTPTSMPRESTIIAQAPASRTTPPPAAAATISQPITVQAGTGVLLRLPQPAATVMSAEPAVARVQPASPTSLFLMGVAPGRTTVIATTDAGARHRPVRRDRHAGRRRRRCQAPLRPPPRHHHAGDGARHPGSHRAHRAGCIGASASGPAGTDAILTGTVPNAAAAQQAEAIARGYVGDKGGVVDNLTVLGTIQVNVRVRIAEINRSVTRQLGFNWQALGNGQAGASALRTGAAATSTITPLLPLGLAPLAGATATANQLGAGFTSGNKLWDVNAIIDALAGDQLITILAEPNLTALSGETASFLAGGEFPIPIAGNTTNGTTTITVEFKKFGVSLAVVPTVMSPTRLNLRVRPEVSQLTNNGAVSVPIAGGTLTIPALTVRRAETTVELGSGQSFAIAGCCRRRRSTRRTHCPGSARCR